MSVKKIPAILLCMSLAMGVNAQDADSLLNQMSSDSGKTALSPAFKSTRVVLSHSTETQKKYDLDMRIRHHFGDIGGEFGNSHTLYGLDVATDLYIGFDYGITDRLTVGIGRSKKNELYNAFFKQRLTRQTSGSMPFSATLMAQAGWITREATEDQEFAGSSDRLSYFIEAILARKFSEHLSLQVSPGYLFRSATEDAADEKALFNIGFAGRLKLTRRMAFVADYQLINLLRSDDLTLAHYNPLGIGLEIETGGHIFSLNFMNAEYIVENNFLPATQKSWTKGGVRFGFTISRNFTLHKSKNPDINSKIY